MSLCANIRFNALPSIRSALISRARIETTGPERKHGCRLCDVGAGHRRHYPTNPRLGDGRAHYAPAPAGSTSAIALIADAAPLQPGMFWQSPRSLPKLSRHARASTGDGASRTAAELIPALPSRDHLVRARHRRDKRRTKNWMRFSCPFTRDPLFAASWRRLTTAAEALRSLDRHARTYDSLHEALANAPSATTGSLAKLSQATNKHWLKNSPCSKRTKACHRSSFATS